MDSTVDALITSADRGDRSAADALFDALYAELHRLASRELARQGGKTPALGVTTLLHQAYVAMAERDGATFPDRARFMAYAARVMRGLIIDNVRYRHAEKRGGDVLMTALDTDVADRVPDDEQQLTELSDALDELATDDPALAEIVDLKFFCGFSFAEIAAMRGVSERTVQRSWDKSRLYLFRSIRGDDPRA
jgi:RNA polymerase sigma factor (TIGR02999 family)